MQFIYPGLLWALTLLALPVIIHLFYFKRFKKVQFSNVRFLKEIKQETSSRNKIKNLLILLMRLLAIAALVFAFAQPFLAGDQVQNSGPKGVSIYVDNSFSMSAEATDESVLQKAKKKAIEISEAYGEMDKIQVFTSDFEGRHQRFVSAEEARGFIDEINQGPQARKISSVINRAKQAMRTENFDNKIIYIISDFQTTSLDDVPSDSTLNINFVPLQAVREANLSIDSVYLDSGVAILNQANTLKLVIRNHGEDKAEKVRLSLQYNNQEKPVGTYDIEGESSITIDATITPIKTGWQKAVFKITDYPIVFDDQYYFSFYVNEEVNVLDLYQSRKSTYLNAVFSSIPYFNLSSQSVNQIQYESFDDMDLIILSEVENLSSGLINELVNYISSGGNVLLFPSSNSQASNYNDLLIRLSAPQYGEWENKRKEVQTINRREFVFDGVFEQRQATNLKLPISTKNYTFEGGRGAQALLKYRDGQSYIVKSSFQKGFIYSCAAPLNREINDLVVNAEIFVPMVYKMALSNGAGIRLAYTIGRDRILNFSGTKTNGDEPYNIIGPKQFIPGQFPSETGTLIDVGDQVQEAGFYELQYNQELKEVYAYNFNNLESSLVYSNAIDLEKQYGDQVNVYNATAQANFTQLINEKDSGIPLWRYFLIGCLGFLLLEQLIIRFVKN